MTPQKWTSVLLTSVILFTSSASFAQADRTVKRSIATVLFSSLGGAILGLSTLSFYGEPEEHTNNITTGALIGFAAGLGYVVYDSSRPAAKTYDYSNVFDQELKSRRALANLAKAPSIVHFSYDF
ncbi:hypothetical protein AZI85_02460 [Bdellovibrio bacteriovorus]|uniref:Uncharacterized protein n=1 Tax=Bdellovibrio bacteriovorus TaxID=959 RepID=A0A150WWY9_BDEBC|nr:hypothetical protein [Bdellovibrio bacteriovorus]KYG70812.1 hypothetical protein AZI85_02460 [Bdellovibrio bacteriovorus]